MRKTSTIISTLCFCFAAHHASAQGGPAPTDPQIAHIAYTAGQIDIKANAGNCTVTLYTYGYVM